MSGSSRRTARWAGALVPTLAVIAATPPAAADTDAPAWPTDADLVATSSEAATPPATKAYDVQLGCRLALGQLRDEQELPVGAAPGMVFDMAWRPTPFLAVGGELGYFRYGWSHHQERYRLVDPRGAETPLHLRYARKNDFAPLLASARLQSPWGRLRPYAQGLAGITFFKTIVDLEAYAGDEDDVIDSLQQIAWTAGVELGIDLFVARRRYSNPEHEASLVFTVGVRRLWNSQATFGLPGSLEAGTRRSSSAVHLLFVGIGGRAERR